MISPSVLLNEASCLGCNSNASQVQLLILALLQRIAEAGGGGGVGSVLSGVGPPVGAPGTATTAIYFDTSDGTQYNYYSGSWH